MNNFIFLVVVMFNYFILNVLAQNDTVEVYFYNAARNNCLRTTGLPESSLTYGSCDNSDNTVWIIPNSHSGNYQSKANPDYCLSIEDGIVSLKKCNENTILYRDVNFIKSPLSDEYCIGSSDDNLNEIGLQECDENDPDQIWYYNIWDSSVVFEEPTVTVYLYNSQNVCIYSDGSSISTGDCYSSKTNKIKDNAIWEIPNSHYGYYRHKANPDKCLSIIDGVLSLSECNENTILYRDGNFIKSPSSDNYCISLSENASQGISVEECNKNKNKQIWYFNIWDSYIATEEPTLSVYLQSGFYCIASNGTSIIVDDCFISSKKINENAYWEIPISHYGYYRLKSNPEKCLSITDGVLSLSECNENSILYRDGNFIKSPSSDNYCISSSEKGNPIKYLEGCDINNINNIWSFYGYPTERDLAPSIDYISYELKDYQTISMLKDLYRIRYLTIPYRTITQDDIDILCNLDTLETLNLDTNYPKGLKFDCFKNLTKLYKLTITVPRVTQNQINMLCNLNDLDKLTLNTNSTKGVNFECFKNATKLTELSVNIPNLAQNEVNMLCNINNLENLTLKTNFVDDVDFECFKNSARLNTLFMDVPHLTQGDVNMICNLTNLKVLSVRTSFEEDVDFECLKKSAIPQIIFNEDTLITQKTINLIRSMVNLKEMVFYKTKFDKGLNYEPIVENITKLNIQITDFPEKFLNFFPNLDTIELYPQETLTQNLFEAIIAAKNLKKLNIVWMQKSEVDFEAITDTSNLRVLTIYSFNRFPLTPNFFKIFSQLEEFGIYNHIYNQEEADGVKSLKNLKNFIVAGDVSFCKDKPGNNGIDIPLDFGPKINNMIMESDSAYLNYFKSRCLIDTTNTTTTTTTTITKTITTITNTITTTISTDPIPTN